ncbi:MAG: helix-turn-helix domain-containing protein, partial [Kordiimonas sp.]
MVVSLKPALTVSIEPGETKTYRVSVVDPVQGYMVAATTPYSGLAKQTLSEIVQIVIATGFFFGLFFVTMFWRRHVRNLATVYYCSYLLFIAVGNLFYHDIPSLIGLSIGYAKTNFIIRNSMEVLASFAMMSFTYELLSLKSQTPRFAIAFKTLSLVPQGTLLVLVWIIPSNSFSSIFGDTIGFLSLTCLLSCLYFAFKRQRTAQILSVSFIVLMAGIILSQLATDPFWAFAISYDPIPMYQTLDIWIYQATLMIEACLIFLACNQHSKELKAQADEEVRDLQTLNTSYEKKLSAALARNKFSDQASTTVPSVQDRFLADTVNIIHQHISDETFGVTALATELAVSERTLRRKIKAATNLSPINFIQQQRILVAHDLIRQRAYATVNEIAYAVGFSSPSHFSKLYKELFDALPVEALKTSANS